MENARQITQACIELLEKENDWVGSIGRIRVVFSGHKGFHIEIKPLMPIDMEEARKLLIQGLQEKKNEYSFSGNTFFKREDAPGTSIDVYHECVRITGSINSWVAHDGEIKESLVYQMTVEEFRMYKVTSRQLPYQSENIKPNDAL